MTSLIPSLLDRLRSHWRLKWFLLATVPTITTGAYLVTQRVILFPAWNPPTTWLDRMIPFQPNWVWAYLSLYLLMPIAPLLTRSRDDLIRYARGVILYFGIGLICFVLLPVAAPRPATMESGSTYEALIRIDRPYNCIPSLHATCAVYALLYAAHASRDTRRRVLRLWLLFLGWIWVALILVSTIATRQHFAIDLPPGILLGIVAFWWTASPRRHP